MKQLVQDLRSGETRLEEVPAPTVRRGHVLIQTRRSLVSLGTERMLVEFGRASLIAKARQQPHRVKQVLDKISADGLLPTLEAVFRKLDQPLPLGYCNVGTVLAVGEGVTDLRIGDRVASNGPHAEVVCVPRKLVAPVPDGVSDDEAVFTVVGAIGLQGIRLLQPTMGETVVVIGLGLIGLLTAELLRISGCRVIGIDVDEAKVKRAQERGITSLRAATAASAGGTEPVKAILALTSEVGADGVLITASAKGDELIAQAARMSRRQGRIVLIGVVGLNLNRADFYEKELTFQTSCSYGPGRYDDVYEQQGHDYPLPYVRWTENRNFETILHFLHSGQLCVRPLISEVVPLAEYARIYDGIGQSGAIASLLRYPEATTPHAALILRETRYAVSSGTVGLIGAGNFTRAMLLPALKQAGANLKTIASAGGLNAALLARQFNVAQATTDYRQILDDPAVDLCIITTRHDSHARLTVEALQAGKHVFVEKPLAIYDQEVNAVIDAQRTSGKTVMVGFNRRFSPHVQKMKALLGGTGSGATPLSVVITVNAGAVPAGSWVHDRAVGGGRILGEAGHFIDLITHLTGSRVASVCGNAMGNHPTETDDSVSMLLRYENGSTGVVNYFSNGSKAYAKERIEVYSQGRTLVLDNFRKLTSYGFGGFSSRSLWQDKGHAELMKQLIRQVRGGGEPLIPFADIINTTQATLSVLHSLREARWVPVAEIGRTKLHSEPARP